MAEKNSQLIGKWKKASISSCSNGYPDQIEFRDGGLYFTQNSPERFSIWDVGTYHVAGPNEVRISLANDAILSYKFAVAEDVLTFFDADKCEFKYRKID
jgi:hypothetical protein